MAHDADEFLKDTDESADDTTAGNFDEEFEESEEDLHDKSAE